MLTTLLSSALLYLGNLLIHGLNLAARQQLTALRTQVNDHGRHGLVFKDAMESKGLQIGYCRQKKRAAGLYCPSVLLCLLTTDL